MKPEDILKTYSKDLSDALLVVSQKGSTKYETLEIKLDSLAGLTYEQIINSNTYSNLIDTFRDLRNPCVYWFEISESSNVEHVWNSFHTFKRKGTHKLPRAKKNLPKNTNILYLGKVKFNLLRRMKEHLGFTRASKTQGLQLCHWASDLGLVVTIHVMEFKQETSNLVGAFEFKLAREMKTILGTHST